MTVKRFIYTISILLTVVAVLSIASFWWLPNLGRKEKFRKLIGVYKIDFTKTHLKDAYLKDSALYKELEIKLQQDSTFELNMEVPFLYSSRGRWTANNVGEWCRLRFDGLNYDGLPYPGTQFTEPFIEENDTLFLINAATPKNGQATISKIFFIKKASGN